MRKPLVAIAVPSYGRWHPAMGLSLATMCAHSAHAGFNLAILSQGGHQVATVRNQLVRSAQAINADFILFLDDDMSFPKETIECLVAHDKDIVGAIYSGRIRPYRMVGGLAEDTFPLARAQWMGAGVMMVRMTVFDRLSPPWFKWSWGAVEPTESNVDGELSEDLYFINQARKSDIEVWCDRALSERVGHIGDEIIGLNGGPFLLPSDQGWKK